VNRKVVANWCLCKLPSEGQDERNRSREGATMPWVSTHGKEETDGDGESANLHIIRTVYPQSSYIIGRDFECLSSRLCTPILM
jgi:hypothetical protein